MKQRYTHFSNKPAKKELNKPSDNHQKEKIAVAFKADNSIKVTENFVSKESGSNTVSEPPMYASNEAAPGISNHKIAALPLNQSQAKSHDGFGVKKIGTELKNNFQKKTDTNRGPISALLRLVLSIILFVILVTLIIVLILLLV
jgi:hypothetical protein